MEPANASLTREDEVMALIDTLKKTLSASDPAGPTTRTHLKETAEKLSIALETPGETVQRVAYYVRSQFNRTSTTDATPVLTCPKMWALTGFACQ